MTIIEKLRELRRGWDLERVSRPDLYGDPPKAVWKRLRRRRPIPSKKVSA